MVSHTSLRHDCLIPCKYQNGSSSEMFILANEIWNLTGFGGIFYIATLPAFVVSMRTRHFLVTLVRMEASLQWRNDERGGVSTHWRLDCYSIVYAGVNQRKHLSAASLAFVRGIHRWPVNSPHKGPVTRRMLPCDDVIMYSWESMKWNTKLQLKQSNTSNRRWKNAWATQGRWDLKKCHISGRRIPVFVLWNLE